MTSSSLHELTVASLEGLASALAEPSPEAAEDGDGEQAMHVLRVYGDAIRLGIEAPRTLRDWATTSPAGRIDSGMLVAESLVEVSGSAGAPGPLDPTTARALLDDEAIEGRFVDRDWAESVLVAARRSLPRGRLEPSPGEATLTEKLARFDARWRAVVSREVLFDLLGERAVLRPEYALGYPESASVVAEAEPKGDPSAALDEELPSDDMIARYLRGGVFARTVEAVAARNADFAETLCAIYDAHAESGEVTSIRAGAWRRRGTERDRTARSKAAVVVGVPPARVAASTTSFEDEGRWAQLGRDETLGCAFEVSIEVLQDALVIHVDFAERGELAEVRVGNASVVVGPDADEVELRVARQPELAFVVRHRDGRQVAETLTLVAEDQASP